MARQRSVESAEKRKRRRNENARTKEEEAVKVDAALDEMVRRSIEKHGKVATTVELVQLGLRAGARIAIPLDLRMPTALFPTILP